MKKHLQIKKKIKQAHEKLKNKQNFDSIQK